MIDEIEAGFSQIERLGKLKQGNGVLKFNNFQIHIQIQILDFKDNRKQ